MNIINQLIRLGSPKRFYDLCGTLFGWSFIFGLTCALIGMIWGLFFAPADYQQGDCFRIIYIHVPCAMYALMIYVVMAMMSAIYLVWRIKIADLVAYGLAPIGAFFTFASLVTGALWGKPMWGTWWIWDARLTSQLILLFLYLGYIGLYQAMERQSAAKACAILALVGVVDIPIIHYSVYWWSTLHQGATISQFAKPQIAGTMLIPLLWVIVGFGFYTLALLCVRARATLLEREQHHNWVYSLIEKKS